MSTAPLEPRLTALETALVELAHAQARTQGHLDRLSDEMRAFKDEMRVVVERLESWVREQGGQGDRRWGELANKMGTLAEDIVAPGIPAVFLHLFGQEPSLAVRVRRRHPEDPGRSREFDVVAHGGDIVLINETRSTLRPGDLDEFVTVLAGDAREYLPEARGKRLVGALASFYVDPSLVRAGERHGLLMLGLATGLLEVLNREGFRPREF